MDTKMYYPLNRRNFMRLGVTALASSSLASPALANIGKANVRSLNFNNLHTGEGANIDYWADGDYIGESLKFINRLLRDHRNGQIHEMEPRLLDLVYQLQRSLGSTSEVQIISAYRSPVTNAAMHNLSKGVATKSLHMEGKAMDIRLADVPLDRLRDAALGLRSGGVGFYPLSDFVHVDVGTVRRWQG